MTTGREEEIKTSQIDIINAYKNLPEYIKDPKITKSDYFSKILGCDLRFVNVHMAGDIGSFKDRGAANQALELVKGKKDQPIHFDAASEGNHSQGCARVTDHLQKQGYNVKTTIYMPAGTPYCKQKETLKKGPVHIKLVLGVYSDKDGKNPEYLIADGPLDPEMVERATNAQKVRRQLDSKYLDKFRTAIYDDALAVAKQEVAKDKNASLIATFDSLKVIEGQGTLAIPIDRERNPKKRAMVFTAVGGGGLAAGMSKYFKGDRKTEVIGMQIKWMPAVIASLCNDGKPISIIENHELGNLVCTNNEKDHLSVDGATIAEAGEHTARILKDNKTEIGSASADEIAYVFYKYLKHEVGIDVANLKETNARKLIHERKKQIPELAGILPLVGALSKSDYIKRKQVFCVLSGGNISEEKIYNIAKLGSQIEQNLKLFLEPGANAFKKLKEAVNEKTGTISPFYNPHCDITLCQQSLRGNIDNKKLQEITNINTKLEQTQCEQAIKIAKIIGNKTLKSLADNKDFQTNLCLKGLRSML